jgi:ADP-ribose pyrophosphatase YjhB (NUDIX family)
MHVVCGIAGLGENILICKRGRGGPYAGRWEFPTALPDAGEMLEDCLERSLFERFSLNLGRFGRFCSFDSASKGDFRVHAFRVDGVGIKPPFSGYDDAKWVNVNKLSRFALVPDAVTLVNVLRKNIVFFPH